MLVSAETVVARPSKKTNARGTRYLRIAHLLLLEFLDSIYT